MKLRDYQQAMADETEMLWSCGVKGVALVLATGGGKSALMSYLTERSPGPALMMAHRQELVSQLSIALARFGVQHNLIAAKETIANIVRIHMAEFGRSFYNLRAPATVASVDTLVRRLDDAWVRQITRVGVDEGHHLTRESKWGKVVEAMPRAQLFSATATPWRADGQGLGRHASGLVDCMVQGPSMRDLIRRGYLSDYTIRIPKNDIDLTRARVSAGGDYNPDDLRSAVHASRQLVGDVVGLYQKHAAGKRGITFCVDVDAAREMCEAYRAAGVSAEVATGDTPDLMRADIFRRLREGKLNQVTAVDIISEGFDLPVLEIVAFARPTKSLSLYRQQFGRVLRPKPDGARGIVHDHVGNVLEHNLPDTFKAWSLNDRDKRGSKTDDPFEIPLRVCPECAAPYERILTSCPYCGHEPQPVARTGPKEVEGDLELLDEATLARMRGEISRVEDSHYSLPYGATPAIAGRLRKLALEKSAELVELRATMDQWGGIQTALGRSHREQQKLFYLAFGTDVMTAQTLSASDMRGLIERIKNAYTYTR